MATTAEGQAKLDKMLAAGMGRQQAMKLLIAAQKKANAAATAAPSASSAPSSAQAEPAPAETGNIAVDQANVLASILNSPLYTESIKSAYLTQYLPGLTQANYEINKARSQEVQNAFLRQQAQGQAIREIAGSYAARGLRTPKMVTEGFAPVQQATALEKNAAEQMINDLIANKEVLYGAGTTDQESFIKNPTLFGSIGAGARRSALSELQQLPQFYGLTQVAQASTFPLGGAPQQDSFTPPSDTVSGTSGLNATQIQAKIDAANKYIKQQQAKNNPTTVAGAQKKLAEYEADLRSVRGY